MEVGIVNKNNYLNTSLSVVIKKHTNIFKWKKKLSLWFQSWNLMEISKKTSKYHLFIKFLDQSKIVFPISKKFKWRPFPDSLNMAFYAKKNIISNQLFRSQNAVGKFILFFQFSELVSFLIWIPFKISSS